MILQDSNVLKEPDERNLMKRARHDVNAFAPVYERYCQRIFAYCYRRVGNHQDAEDLTSQIFTRAIASLNGYRGGSPAAWLFKIARNTVYNYYRDRTTYVSLNDSEPELREDPHLLDSLIMAESTAQLSELLEHLDDYQRDLLALKMSAGLSAKEIGEIVGKTSGAVRVEIHRIILQLREMVFQEENTNAPG